MKAPCKNRINACDGMDPPFANLSAEETDVVRPVYYPDFWGGVTPAPPYVPPEPGPDAVFGNSEQTARFTCSDGTIQTYTVPVRWYFGYTQDEADAAALSFANESATDMCGGQPAPIVPDPNPDPFDPANPNPDPDDPNTDPNNPFTCTQGFHNENGVCVPDNPTPPYNPNPPPGQMYSNVACSQNVPCADGLAFWYTVIAGLFKSKKGQQFVNDQACAEAVRLATKYQICLSALDMTGCAFGCECLGADYFAAITATGSGLIAANAGGTTANWKLLSGSLPPGLSMLLGAQPIANQSSTTIISGTPTAVGTYNFSVRVTTVNGYRQTRAYTIIIAGITDATPLPDADFMQTYSFTFHQSGFTGTKKWTVVMTEQLPPGLILDENTGWLHGSPTIPGDYTFVVQVATVDGNGIVLFRCLKTFTLYVDAVLLGQVVLCPTPGLSQEVYSYHYNDVEQAAFTDWLGVFPAGDYQFSYVKGAFIQYIQDDGKAVHVVSSHAQPDYMTHSGGTILPLKDPIYPHDLPICFNVGEVETRDYGYVSFQFTQTVASNISVNYVRDPADILESANVTTYGIQNSVWSLGTPVAEGFWKYTDILIGSFPDGDYVLIFDQGAANYASENEYNTRGFGDEIINEDESVILSVPAKTGRGTWQEAETDAHNEILSFTFTHTGDPMYWRLRTLATDRVIHGYPLPVWKLYAVPPPPP